MGEEGEGGSAKHELPSALLRAEFPDFLRPACEDEPDPSVGCVWHFAGI